MHRFRFLLLLVACWLPIQTAYAVAMPFCRHAMEQVLAADAATHCPQHDANAEVAADQGAGCDDCAVCHMAGAGYLPATTANLPSLPGQTLTLLPIRVLHSHIGDPPQQPPRRLN